jgi:hypothetical protein
LAWLLLACVSSTGTPPPPRLSALHSLRGIGGDGVEFEAGRVMARAASAGILVGRRQRERRRIERHVVKSEGAIGLGIRLRGGGILTVLSEKDIPDENPPKPRPRKGSGRGKGRGDGRKEEEEEEEEEGGRKRKGKRKGKKTMEEARKEAVDEMIDEMVGNEDMLEVAPAGGRGGGGGDGGVGHEEEEEGGMEVDADERGRGWIEDSTPASDSERDDSKDARDDSGQRAGGRKGLKGKGRLRGEEDQEEEEEEEEEIERGMEGEEEEEEDEDDEVDSSSSHSQTLEQKDGAVNTMSMFREISGEMEHFYDFPGPNAGEGHHHHHHHHHHHDPPPSSSPFISLTPESLLSCPFSAPSHCTLCKDTLHCTAL